MDLKETKQMLKLKSNSKLERTRVNRTHFHTQRVEGEGQ